MDVAVLTYGEGWHNNHHVFQTSARRGRRWREVDMTYVAIRVLSTGGLAHSAKLPKLTPATPHLRDGDLAGAIACQSPARVRSGVF
jgi:fatty-acid desaturase